MGRSPQPDPLRALLAKHGAPPHVVDGGLQGLVALWESFAADVERGYDLGLDDYLNELDGRTLIASCLGEAAREPSLFAHPATEALRERVAAADALLRRATIPRRTSLWGEAVSDRRGWTAAIHWWLFRVPKQPGPALREDLAQLAGRG